MKENWKAIPGFIGYLVSNHGHVKSLSRKVLRQGRSKIHLLKVEGRVIKPRIAGGKRAHGGYRQVALKYAGTPHYLYVHRLVAQAFIKNDNPTVKTDVNHKNGIKTDNRVENLEWCTRSENMRHAKEVLGRCRQGVGVSSRFSKKDVLDMRARRKAGVPIIQIAQEYKTSYATVYRIVTGARWALL